MIEFVIMCPLIFSCFMMSMEMSMYAVRQLFLERSLDITVRYIRLNTNANLTHNLVKNMICDTSGSFLPDCKSVLRLEMKRLNPRSFAAYGQAADCVDVSEPVEPVRGFELGKEHQLMILRACYKFKPLFPSTGLGYAYEKDGSGRVSMVALNAFVQEPG